MAHALAGSGARILILERGDFVPQEAENWDPRRLEGPRYQSAERWLDDRGREFRPHALQRRRKYQVLGQRALSAAA